MILCCSQVFNRCNYSHYIEIPSVRAGNTQLQRAVYQLSQKKLMDVKPLAGFHLGTR